MHHVKSLLAALFFVATLCTQAHAAQVPPQQQMGIGIDVRFPPGQSPLQQWAIICSSCAATMALECCTAAYCMQTHPELQHQILDYLKLAVCASCYICSEHFCQVCGDTLHRAIAALDAAEHMHRHHRY